MPDKNSDLLAALPLDQVLSTIPSGLFLVNQQQRIVYWNREAERITGYSAAEAVGQHCSFLAGIPCGSGCGLFEKDLPKPVIGATCTVQTADGRRITLLKNIDYLRDATGAVVGGVESFIDLSHQAALEEELRRQAADLEETVRRRTAELEAERTQLRNLLDAMADLAYICSSDRRIIFMNRAMIAAFGDRTGQTCHEVFFGSSTPCDPCPLQRILAGETCRQEQTLAATGRLYDILHSPLRAPDGSVLKLAVFRDVTERKEAEEKLREINRELDAFVSTVAHDLRTPITPIIAYADYLREEYGARMEASALEMLEEIEKQGQRLLDLLEDLLVLARVGHLQHPETPVDTSAVLGEVLEEFAERIEQDNVTVEIRPLPPLSIPETLLFQVFANLIGNALRYAGGPGARIEVGGTVGTERAHLFVRDHGPGIPTEERQRIFDPFYRAATSRSQQGTGIGLAIVRKVVRLYGGRIYVEDTPGGGATFRFDLPLHHRPPIEPDEPHCFSAGG